MPNSPLKSIPLKEEADSDSEFPECFSHFWEDPERITEAASCVQNHSPLFVAEHPVGLKYHLSHLGLLLGMGHDDVRIIGIEGDHGSGKTTLARAMYNEIADQFDVASFVADVGEEYNKRGDSVKLQEKILADILGEGYMELRNIDRSNSVIRKILQFKRVLLILDDVRYKGRLEKLVGVVNWFGPGSRIIITTTGYSAPAERVYTMDGLDDEDCLELFSWHAFKREVPLRGYAYVTERAARCARGFPLLLEILGSHLCGKELGEWKCELDTLEKYRKEKFYTPDDEYIRKILQFSYDDLEENEKEIFHDLAWFFIGEELDYVEKMLDARGLHAKSGIGVLIDKCFIKVENNKVKMHYYLCHMGREINRRSKPRSPIKTKDLSSGIQHIWTEEDDCFSDDDSEPSESSSDDECFDWEPSESRCRYTLSSSDEECSDREPSESRCSDTLSSSDEEYSDREPPYFSCSDTLSSSDEECSAGGQGEETGMTGDPMEMECNMRGQIDQLESNAQISLKEGNHVMVGLGSKYQEDNMMNENTITNMDCDYEEFNSSKQPKLVSKVWEDIQRIQTSECSKVQCGHCGKPLQDDWGTSQLKHQLDICSNRPTLPNDVTQESMASVGIRGTDHDKVLTVHPSKVEPGTPVTSSAAPKIQAPTISTSAIKIMRELHQKTGSAALLPTSETPKNQIDVTLDDVEMNKFYASLDAEAAATSALSFSQDLTDAVPCEETKKSMKMLKEFLSKDFTTLLHPEQCGAMKTTLEQLSNLSANDGISLEMQMLILEISRDFARWSQDYNNADRLDVLGEDLEAKKNQFMEFVCLETEISNQMAQWEERKKKLKEQINAINSDISSFRTTKNKVTHSKREIFEEAKTLKAQRDELRGQIPHVREESDSVKKMQENMRAEWSKLGKKFNKSFGAADNQN